MYKLTHIVRNLGWRRIVFSLVVLAYVGFLGFINALMFLPAVGLVPDNVLSAMGHFGSFIDTGETHDLIHEFVFAFIVGTAAVGLLSQLWKPEESASWRIAGQLVALVTWGVLILMAAITNSWAPQPLFIIFGGLTLLATILHPAGRGLFSWFRGAKVNRALLGLVIIAAVPLLSLAATNINLQRAGMNVPQNETGEFFNLFGHKIPKHSGGEDGSIPSADPTIVVMNDEAVHDQKHSALGHYRNLAALSIIIVLVGTLASLRPSGWRLAAWVAGFLPIALGLASAILPAAESSLGVIWGLAAIAWGITFIAAAEFTVNRAG